MNGNFESAVKDFRYLLDRGYRRESALKFVGDRYNLVGKRRLLLYRCIYGADDADKHKRKLYSLNVLRGEPLAVDGYNVLITVESALQGRPLILCDDGFTRDLAAVHGKHKITLTTELALKLIAETLRENEVGKVKIFFDSQVSRSGKLASLSRKIFAEAQVDAEAAAVKQADAETLKFPVAVASSDAVVIEKAEKVVDLAGEIAKKYKPHTILHLQHLNVQLLQALA